MIAGFFMVLIKQLSQTHGTLNKDITLVNQTQDTPADAVSVYLNTFKFNKMENSYTWDDGRSWQYGIVRWVR